MEPITSHKSTSESIGILIAEAEEAEKARDMGNLARILAVSWNDFDLEPDFREFELEEQARLYRLAGFFLSYYGMSQSIKNCQPRGMDLLGKAKYLFDKLQMDDAAAESEVMTAFCFWNQGAINECELILESVETIYVDRPSHPVNLQAKINRLMVLFKKELYLIAVNIITEIEQFINQSDDLRLKALFHNQASIIYTNIAQFELATYHYERSTEFSIQLGNFRSVALNHNNQAYLFKQKGEFEKALTYIDMAIDILSGRNDNGLLANILDTKAQILIDKGQFHKALSVIEESIAYFRQGDDYQFLCDSLWIRTKILAILEKYNEALRQFSELSTISATYISEEISNKFAQKFLDLIYIKKGTGFKEEVRRFKKHEVKKALKQSNFSVSEAAQILQLTNHQALSEILHKQLPEVYAEMRMPRRAPRNSRKTAKKLKSKDSITLINTERLKLNFDSTILVSPDSIINCFHVEEKAMSFLNINTSSIIAVKEQNNYLVNEIVLAKYANMFHLGVIRYDSKIEMFYLENAAEVPLPLEDAIIVGKVIRFCSVSEIKGNEIYFSQLSVSF